MSDFSETGRSGATRSATPLRPRRRASAAAQAIVPRRRSAGPSKTPDAPSGSTESFDSTAAEYRTVTDLSADRSQKTRVDRPAALDVDSLLAEIGREISQPEKSRPEIPQGESPQTEFCRSGTPQSRDLQVRNAREASQLTERPPRQSEPGTDPSDQRELGEGRHVFLSRGWRQTSSDWLTVAELTKKWAFSWMDRPKALDIAWQVALGLALAATLLMAHALLTGRFQSASRPDLPRDSSEEPVIEHIPAASTMPIHSADGSSHGQPLSSVDSLHRDHWVQNARVTGLEPYDPAEVRRDSRVILAGGTAGSSDDSEYLETSLRPRLDRIRR